MELTNELKERFKALYWGQWVLCDPTSQNNPFQVNRASIYVADCYLELRPLSSMTEKEKNHLASLDRISGADYIRSIGVLISFMGISSDRWISSGVVKLKES